MSQPRCAGRGCEHVLSVHRADGTCSRCDEVASSHDRTGYCRGWATRRRHAWRNAVWEAWHAAFHAWWLQREAECMGYRTEEEEWAADHPCPRLGDFMVALSHGTPHAGT